MTLVSDVLMALFLFVTAKELWEALILEQGALKGRQAILPTGMVLGGMIGAALVWIAVASLIETAEEAAFATGWQVPLGSDAVLCFVVGRAIFGRGHPALHLVLLVAIASDILGLLVAGLTDPTGSLRPVWLLLPVAASFGVWRVLGRPPAPGAPERARRMREHLLPYVAAGLASWVGVAASGLPPALGLLPVIPAIAHADRSFGLFAEVEEMLRDPLNRLAHALVLPVTAILFLFGLTRGGIDLSAFAPTTVTTLAALWVGRPLGMLVGGIGLIAVLGQKLPPGVNLRDVLRVVVILGMGFTVPILALDTALPGGAMQEAARLGLALSLAAGVAALLVRRRAEHG
jgi:Na+:H+ antiporter, NhaA family